MDVKCEGAPSATPRVGASSGESRREKEEELDKKRTVLVACVGTSPAVLTETVWALAHETPPCVPDEIVALTTKSGRDRLLAEILGGAPSVWTCLCESLRGEKIDVEGKLVFGDALVRVIPDAQGNGIGDLRTGEDNLRAADFMLQQLRQYTESPDTVVLASIAGGRKTMSALLFSCMTLLGRESDKVYHVLLPPEFEGGVEPPMFYPVKGVTYVNRATGKRYRSDKFHSELFEIPFVRMRGWYQERFKSIPPSYRTLVSKIQTVAPPALAYPKVEIDLLTGMLRLDGFVVRLSSTEFATLALLAKGCPMKSLHGRLVALHNARSGRTDRDWLESFKEGSRFENPDYVDDLYKTVSSLRKKLKAADFAAADTLVPLRMEGITFPIDRVVWRNDADFAEVCGCPNVFSGKDDVV